MSRLARLFLPLLLAATCPAQDPAVEAAQRALKDPKVQSELPVPGEGNSGSGRDGADPSTGAGGSGAGPEADGGSEGWGFSLAPLESDGLLQALVWILLGALVLFLLVRIASAFAERARDAEIQEAKPRPVIQDSSAEELAALDPAALAAVGRYTEALHTLYLQVVDRLARDLRPSVTNRELLRRLQLEPAQRAAFEGLSRSVENAVFGGIAVDEEEWRAGLRHAQSLSRAVRSARR